LALEHKHVPETQLYARLPRRPIFVPLVGRFRQGMLVSVPLHLDTLPGKPGGADLAAVLARHYEGYAQVRVVPPSADGKLEPEALNDTNLLELRVYTNQTHRQAVLVALLDNLGKGASGAAVQNIGLIIGVDAATTEVWVRRRGRADMDIIRIGGRTNLQDGTIVHVDSGDLATHIGDDVTIG